jgi:prefoldin subunit 5
MREQAKLRLEELKKEFETGQSQLQELDRQQTRLRETLLRISGAIQILDEMLASESSQPQDHPASSQVAGSIPIAQKSGA